jgi:hypothetical protein
LGIYRLISMAEAGDSGRNGGFLHYLEACGSVVGSGTMLQAGRSRVPFPMWSMDFSINLIFPAALWPWDRLSLKQK